MLSWVTRAAAAGRSAVARHASVRAMAHSTASETPKAEWTGNLSKEARAQDAFGVNAVRQAHEGCAAGAHGPFRAD